MLRQQNEIIEMVREAHKALSLSQIAEALSCGVSTVRGILKGKECSVAAACLTSEKIDNLIMRTKYCSSRIR